MAGDTTITVIGNLTDDPELRFTPSGAAVAKFRVASTPRFMDKASGEWKDGEPLFLACTVWRQAAENVAESLQRGARVIVSGRLRQRSYETREGEKRTVIELEVDEIGPSLRYATAKVQKMSRSGGAGGGFGGGGGGPQRQLTGEKASGTVKFFNAMKGFGFISRDDGQPDAFVHISAVERAGLPTLNEGDRLEFELEVDRRGKTAAVNLQPIQ
jgi:single-strand DNA-binding protein